MYFFIGLLLAVLALRFLSQALALEERTMDVILNKEWHWIVRSTSTIVSKNQGVMINEPIDAAFVYHIDEAVSYGKARHGLKPNQMLSSYACRNPDERRRARELNALVSERIAEFEEAMNVPARAK